LPAEMPSDVADSLHSVSTGAPFASTSEVSAGQASTSQASASEASASQASTRSPEPPPTTGAILAALFRGGPLRQSDVRIIDHPEPRIHHPSNVAQLVAAALGIGLTLLFSVYAHATAVGLTADLRGVTDALHAIFAIPVNVLEGLLTVMVPVVVLTELAVQRQVRQAVEAVLAAAVAFALTVGVAWLLVTVAADTALLRGLSVVVNLAADQWLLTIPAFVSAITAFLVVAGPPSRRRSVRWSWRLLTAVLLIFVIAGRVSATGAVLTVLLGLLAGQAAQYVAGIPSERAYGTGLVAAIERAGWRPAALIRIGELGQPASLDSYADPADAVTDWAIPQPGPARSSAHPAGDNPPPVEEVISQSSDSMAAALARSSRTRVYAMIDRAGIRYDVEVLDGDRQVHTMMQRLWRLIRLRVVAPSAIVSLKSVTERTALLSLSASAAGVRTPRLLGVGMEADSAVLVLEHLRGATALRDLPAPMESVANQIMDEAWQQILRAHRAGLAHHHLTSDVLLITPGGRDSTLPGVSPAPQNNGLNTRGDFPFYSSFREPAESAGYAESGTAPQVWITGWEQGEIAASNLAKRLDLVQLLALFALWVGSDLALAGAARNLNEKELAGLSPLLQTVALPAETRTQVLARKPLLANTRAALIAQYPGADLPTQQITRFNLRTIVMFVITVAAIAVVVTTVNFAQIREALLTANPWWIAAAFGFGMITTIGGALSLVAFSPSRLSFRKTVLAQWAGSFVALATPAGIGPAALNLRFLNRQKIATATGLAVVALAQASQIVVTVLLLLVLTLATGSGGLITLPSTTIMLTILGVLAVIVILMLIPPVRAWAWGRIAPTLKQLWPRLSAMLSQPTRLVAGLGGNVLMSVGYVAAFYAALQAFGRPLAITDAAVIFLVGNTMGALIPTPGGLVGVEGALIAGLTAAGLSVAIATSVTLLFRLVTYWLRIPLGWLAMKFLESKGDL